MSDSKDLEHIDVELAEGLLDWLQNRIKSRCANIDEKKPKVRRAIYNFMVETNLDIKKAKKQIELHKKGKDI